MDDAAVLRAILDGLASLPVSVEVRVGQGGSVVVHDPTNRHTTLIEVKPL